ncbi:MAG: exosortase/archaeosortase family protein [Candidatus Bathyarchaeia archaeon]
MSSRASLINFIIYTLLAILISIMIYYLPDYSFLEFITAQHSAVMLNLIGIQAKAWSIGNKAFLNEVQIVRDCTGIQVIAVFMGILLPLPKASWRRKLLAVAIVAISVYLANVARIALEIWLLYNGILPWSLAHYPLGIVLGVFSVAFLVIVANFFIPEISEFINSLSKELKKYF